MPLYEFGPRLQKRLDTRGGGLADALQAVLQEYNLPSLMGNDDIFGMSDVRGLLRWGEGMGVDPLTMGMLGKILPNFDSSKWGLDRQKPPVFYNQWAKNPNTDWEDYLGPPVPDPPAQPYQPVSPGVRGDRPRPNIINAGGGTPGDQGPRPRPQRPQAPPPVVDPVVPPSPNPPGMNTQAQSVVASSPGQYAPQRPGMPAQMGGKAGPYRRFY